MVILLRSRFQWPRTPAAIGVATAGFGVFCLHRGEYLRFFAQKDRSGGAKDIIGDMDLCYGSGGAYLCWKDHNPT